jgi:D-serine deaminase-like pyridoxal phosphate-dependent protein
MVGQSVRGQPVSAVALLAEAAAAGLALRAEDGRLHWRADAPPASDLLARLRRHKAALLDLLTEVDERAGILEFDGGVPREHADAQAMAEVLARVETRATP